jgi:hypothetical protein
MTIPNLKRIKVHSIPELTAWLAKQPRDAQSVMLVTYTDTSHDKYVSHEQLRDAITAHGWATGFRYTLNGNFLGHVISKP